MIAVVDYHKGNLKSAERGLIDAGGDARITDDPSRIAQASAIVLPGVGAFADAVASMDELGQMAVLRERIGAGVPFLGICLGLQLMFAEGDEGAPVNAQSEIVDRPRGIGVIPGCASLLPATDAAGEKYKIPHVGWNSVEYADPASGGLLPADAQSASPLFANVKNGEYFYYTHSYVGPDNPYTIAVTTHSRTFPAAVRFGEAAYGVQFHPEKSSNAGAQVMRNFVGICRNA